MNQNRGQIRQFSRMIGQNSRLPSSEPKLRNNPNLTKPKQRNDQRKALTAMRKTREDKTVDCHYKNQMEGKKKQ